MRDLAKTQDEFFIGWLALPPSYRRLWRWLTPLLVGLALALGIFLPTWQKNAGSGDWEIDRPVVIEGAVRSRPYAMIRARIPGAGNTIRTILLVSEGKFGAAHRIAPFDGKFVQVHGTFLHRDDRWMLELATDEQAIQLSTPTPLLTVDFSGKENVQRSTVSLRGEIIDPKCYLGAMRPGGGKTHRACAALCISGGVPPMLVTRDETGAESYFLLIAADGSSAADQVLRFVGDFVEIKGELMSWEDLHVLRIDRNTIRRL